MQERRSFPRTGLALPVHLTVVPSAGNADEFSGALSGTTRDPSRGGCAIITEVEVTERTRRIARFPLADGRPPPPPSPRLISFDDIGVRISKTLKQVSSEVG